MAASNSSQDLLINEANESLFQPGPVFDEFKVTQTDFQDWLRVWRMDVSEPTSRRDIFNFARGNQEKSTNVVQQSLLELKNVKVGFGLEVKFAIERDGETQRMKHYFKNNRPFIFNRYDGKEDIKEKFDEFIQEVEGEIESWSERGSGWGVEGITMGYVNVARNEPLRGGTYLPLPIDLAKKKAIINVQNRDNECLKWALRAALFPPQDGKNAQRPSKYPVKDGIDYKGITFPTPVRQIEKLEAQNSKLAINVFGWENDRVSVHRVSKKEVNVPRINLMLIESKKTQHYCYVKRLSALLYDQTKRKEAKHYCVMCLTGFTKAEILENHQKYCNGVNGTPTRIEMPEEGENTLTFKNHKKMMRAPFVIYADFEALVRKIPEGEREQTKNTEKTEWHEACGYAYKVVRSDGEVTGSKVYRGENAVGEFLGDLQQEEMKIRKALSVPKPIKMTWRDWESFKMAVNCHICNKSLIKDEFLDSMPIWNIEEIDEKSDKKSDEKSDEKSDKKCIEKWSYWGQGHKKCFYKAQKNLDQDQGLKRLTKEKDKMKAKEQKDCMYCQKPLLQKNFRDAVKDHCHITGRYRGVAHNECNYKLRINPKTDKIPVVFHNLKGYDAHHLMQAMSQQQKEVNCIANNMEKYITLSLGGLSFIDSLNVLQGSLDALVRATPQEELKITATISQGSDLLFKKGIYPYEYMDEWERFTETRLPEKESFYSKLNDENITDEEYKHAQTVWEAFGCETLGDYHDLYVETDVALLADVFENFRNLCEEQYGLDPAHYFTSPGLSWDALLKKTGVELELLTDIDMHLFVERGMRGGISMVSKRYAKANNPQVPGYDASKPNKYIAYLDANNLYGWAMSKPLPTRGFKWKNVFPTEEEILKKKEKAKKGWILEVDLEYPRELHEEHNSYPLAPEKKVVKRDKMSRYQKKLIEDLELKPPESKKLLLTLEGKNNYVVHYRNLQFYLKQGMKLLRVHRVLEFEQECWMEPYIRMNTEFRKKAKSNFEKDFYKLMNNSVFGKTMENLRNRVDIKIVRSSEMNKIRKLVASPLYKGLAIFTKDMFGIEMRKSKLILNKPVYVGMTILDNSKILMYDFFYNELKRQYGEKCELLYTDTDSLLLEIETEDFYKDMEEKKDLYDTSDYPREHPLHSNENKKVLGKMKDECAGTLIAEAVCLRPKMYSILKADEKNIKKAKGVKRNVIKKIITHENFKETLLSAKEQKHGMNILRSEGHKIFGMHVDKISLSPFDSKRWIEEDGVHTKAYGYRKPLRKFTDEEFEQMEEYLLELLGG